jgi:hypothetical protein
MSVRVDSFTYLEIGDSHLRVGGQCDGGVAIKECGKLLLFIEECSIAMSLSSG